MNARRAARRLGRIIVHNWPLKLAAVVLATLLYAGLVASQDDTTFPGRIPVGALNQPAGTILGQLREVERIRYVAPADLGPLRADDFRATVDLAQVEPDGQTVFVRVDVAAPPGVGILEVFPATIPVTLDQTLTRTIGVSVVGLNPPDGVQIGDIEVDPARVSITGASAAVNRVATVQVAVTLDSSLVPIDRDLAPQPLDGNGNEVTGISVQPTLVNVQVPVFTDLENRTVPVNPVVTGTPGAGFRIAAISVDPTTVTVEGNLDQLAQLVSADTAPVVISGATRDVTAEVALALPTGVTPVGRLTARVTVRIAAVTETRTFTAGIRLDGRDAALRYDPAGTEVLLTLFGSTADLDRLGGSAIVIALNVADLEPGVHEVPVVPSVPSAVSVAAISPETITVTVSVRPTPAPPPTPTPTPAPATSPGASDPSPIPETPAP